MKLLIADNSQKLSPDVIQVSSEADLMPVLKVFNTSSFDTIESGSPLSSKNNLIDKDLWKALFTILKENGELSLQLASGAIP